MARNIRVLIIDDSALVRSILSNILSADPEIEVVATAADPYEAREKIKLYNPDVVTLDIEMPNMSGLDFLEKIMTLRPMPVVMVSSLTQRGAEETIRALEIGAVDTVAKPNNSSGSGLETLAAEIVSKVKLASVARIRSQRTGAVSGALHHAPSIKNRDQVIAIGASTGGVEAIREIFVQLPPTLPPIVITQHMPTSFMASFAQRLDRISKIRVEIAGANMPLHKGCAYVAPGDHHLEMRRDGERYICVMGSSEKISGHCPSVDAMFHSVASVVGGKAVGVILTGMGSDGARGLLAMRRTDAITLGQSETSCVVYGMPKKAYELGAVRTQLPLDAMAQAIVSAC